MPDKKYDELHQQIVERLQGSTKFDPKKCISQWQGIVDKANQIVEKPKK